MARCSGAALLAAAMAWLGLAREAEAACNPPDGVFTELLTFTVKDQNDTGNFATAAPTPAPASNPKKLYICQGAAGTAKIEMSATIGAGSPEHVGWRIEKATGKGTAGDADLVSDGTTGHADPNQGKVIPPANQSTLTVTRSDGDVRKFYVKAFCDGNKDGKMGPDEDYYYDTTPVTPKPIEVQVFIITVDLNINTDDHPKEDWGLPRVSDPGDVTDSDEAGEDSLGGYLWVNDDNDHHVVGDSTLDKDDPGGYTDDDLEPITYNIPDAVWATGLKVEVIINFPDDHLRVWQNNKNHPLLPGIYSSPSDLDTDVDGVLYLEGRDSGVGTLGFRVKDGTIIVCEDWIRATVFAVSDVRWERYLGPGSDTVVEADPGGQPDRTGVRVFPDKRSLLDDSEHDKPRIVTTLTPPIPIGSGWHVPLATTVFDVDHYSSDENFDPNTAEGADDNRTGNTVGDTGDASNIGIEVLLGGTVVATSAPDPHRCYWYESIDESSSSRGEALLHITHHTPCNNWRVVTGCAGPAEPGYLGKAVQLDPANGEQLRYINGDAVADGSGLGTPSRSTDTLTVWRKLYLEEDKMASTVDFYDGPGYSRSMHLGYVTAASSTTLSTLFAEALLDQWKGGQIQFYETYYPVHYFLGDSDIMESNGASGVLITTATAVPAGTDFAVAADDDVLSFLDSSGFGSASPKIHPAPPYTGLMNEADMFPAACIEVSCDTLDTYDTPDVAFELHVADKHVIVSSCKGVQGGEDFWVSTALVAYESDVYGSNDPDSASSGGGPSSKGTSCPYWDSPAIGSCGGFLVFAETTRDSAAHDGEPPDIYLQHVTIHECGHTLGGRHGDSGIMDAPGLGGAFSGKSLRRFMLLQDAGPSIKP
jgi:hypothetical protein